MTNIIDKMEDWYLKAGYSPAISAFGTRLASLREDLEDAGIDENSEEAAKALLMAIEEEGDHHECLDEILAAYETFKKGAA